MKPRISLVTLGVADVDAAARFYETAFGMTREPSPPSVAFLALQGTWLGLYGRAALAEDAGVPPGGSGFAGVTLAHNLDSEAAVDAAMKDAIAAGATLVKPPQKVFWGGYSGYFQDPDGHLWELAHNPFMQIGPTDDVP
jgi:uncharacterized glyoxalase superfamily protein PhnB